MLTFAEKAEKKNSEYRTKYVTSKFKDNGTQFYYQTTPHHPTENADPSQRYLKLNFESPYSQDTIDKLLSFLAITELFKTKSSSLDLSTLKDENIEVRQLYVPEFDIHHYNIRLTMPKETRETPRFDTFALMFSKMMEEFYGVKLGLSYDGIFHHLNRKGKDKSEGVIGFTTSYSGPHPYYFDADIFQSPVELNAVDIVRTFFQLHDNVSYAILKSISSFSGESLHAKSSPNSSLKFEFDTGSVGPEKRIQYGNRMFDVYRKITGTTPEPKFSTQDAFTDVK